VQNTDISENVGERIRIQEVLETMAATGKKFIQKEKCAGERWRESWRFDERTVKENSQANYR